jgi:predicted ferric reductase
MPKKHYKFIIKSLIWLTTLPFFLLLTNLDFKLLNTEPDFFWSDFMAVMANILGFVGTVLMFWGFLLGIRYLVSLMTPDVVWANKLHGFLGKYGTVLVLAHPILEMVVYAKNWTWLLIPDFSTTSEYQITYGRYAIILFLIIFFSSAIIRKGMKYRPWLYIHYLSYPLMFFTFLHALQIGTYLNKFVFLKAFWFATMALYFCLLVYRFAMWSGIFKPKYTINAKAIQGEDIVLMALKPNQKILTPKVGQYFYLQIKNFGESHPFSIMEYDQSNGTMIFAIKTLGNFTQKIANLEIGDELMVDGPYGVFTLEAQNDLPKVIIAGIGITPFVDLIKKYKSPKTLFIYANRKLDQAVARPVLQRELGNHYLDFLSQDKTTGFNIVNNHLEPKHLSQILGQNNLNNFNYFICGSPRFNDGIQKMLQNLDVHKSRVYAEEFGF